MTLLTMVAARNLEGMAEYITTRYEIVVADEHVVKIMMDIDLYCGNGKHCGEHCAAARLNNWLQRLNYFHRMFGYPDEPSFSARWNLLHLPWPRGAPFLDAGIDKRSKQTEAKSKITKTMQKVQPVDRVAYRVAPPPK